jgi:hypothetical protein
MTDTQQAGRRLRCVLKGVKKKNGKNIGNDRFRSRREKGAQFLAQQKLTATFLDLRKHLH